MKKFGLILLSVIPVILNAQNNVPLNYQEVDSKWIHFGFLLGLNAFDYTIKLNPDYVKTDSLTADVISLKPGFHVACVASLRLNDYMDLRASPGMSFGARHIYFQGTPKSDNTREMKIEFYPIELPLTLKLKADRISNYRPYLTTGFTMRYDMASTKKFDEENKIYVKFKRFDAYYGFGFGVDYYFTFFKLSTEARMDFGLRDMLKHDPHPSYPQYTQIFKSITSNLIYLTFCFE